jgi:hypothetical protein
MWTDLAAVVRGLTAAPLPEATPSLEELPMMTTLPPPRASENGFARGLGFDQFDDLVDASQPLFSPVGELWFVAPLPDGRWLAWPFPEYDDAHLFETHEATCDFVAQTVTR